MKKLSIALILMLIAFNTYTTSAQTLTANDKKALVEQHNYWRAQVGAPELVWDDHLAKYAQEWANHLKKNGFDMEHRDETPYGENIYWTSAPVDATDIVDSWAAERKQYRYGKFTAAQLNCGHYTQVVWDTTTKVGCGMATDGEQQIWVCNYDPAGNMLGEYPYKKK